jgi:L-iditol 2-dehydrogenase
MRVKAAVYYGPGDVRIEERDLPAPGPGEVAVRMLACGICGSDLMDWYLAPRAPTVLGHEPVGVVAEVGPVLDGVEPPPVGSRVFVHHHVPCFVCDYCRRGNHSLCATFRRTRIEPGGFAERILVPVENVRSDLLVLPDGVATEAATVIEPLACCVRGVARAGIGPGSRLLVVGAGQMGLLYLQAARAAGCTSVVVAEPREDRRRLAERFGARAVEPTADAVRAAGETLPTVAALCTGAAAGFELAFETLDGGGVLQLFAPATPDTAFSFDVNRLFFSELEIQASYSASPHDTREALRLLAEGLVVAGGLITDRFPLADAAGALARARSGQAIKVVVLGEDPR